MPRLLRAAPRRAAAAVAALALALALAWASLADARTLAATPNAVASLPPAPAAPSRRALLGPCAAPLAFVAEASADGLIGAQATAAAGSRLAWRAPAQAYALSGAAAAAPPAFGAGTPLSGPYEVTVGPAGAVAWLSSGPGGAGADGRRPAAPTSAALLPADLTLDGTECVPERSSVGCDVGGVGVCRAAFCCARPPPPPPSPTPAAAAAAAVAALADAEPPSPPPAPEAAAPAPEAAAPALAPVVVGAAPPPPSPASPRRPVTLIAAAAASAGAVAAVLAAAAAVGARRRARRARWAATLAARPPVSKQLPGAAPAIQLAVVSSEISGAARRVGPPPFAAAAAVAPPFAPPATLRVSAAARAPPLPLTRRWSCGDLAAGDPASPWTPESTRARRAQPRTPFRRAASEANSLNSPIWPDSPYTAADRDLATPGTAPAPGVKFSDVPLLGVDPADIVLGERLGTGSFGVVHAATWRGAPVAVKLLRGADPESLASFANEVAVLAGRRIPRVVTLYGACLDPERACLVQELVPGGSLAARLAAPGPYRSGPGGGMPYGAVLRVGADVAAALAALAPAVAHRDVKAANVLCAVGGRYKLCDFGIARVRAAGAPPTVGAGAGAGTAPYMAPEQFSGTATCAADVWALGCLLAQCWSGVVPFEGLQAAQIAYAVGVHGETPDLPSDAPPFLARTLRACWARDPTARPRAGDLAAGLEAEAGKVALAAAAARRAARAAAASSG